MTYNPGALKIAAGIKTEDLTHEEVQAMRNEMDRLRIENAKLAQKGSSFKVTDKGGISVYGLGRFPVTLYRAQWLKLIETCNKPEFQAAVNALPEKAKTQVDAQVNIEDVA